MHSFELHVINGLKQYSYQWTAFLCVDGLKKILRWNPDTMPESIRITVRDSRPGKKGWRKLTVNQYGGVSSRYGGTVFESITAQLLQQRGIIPHNGRKHIWVKIESL